MREKIVNRRREKNGGYEKRKKGERKTKTTENGQDTTPAATQSSFNPTRWRKRDVEKIEWSLLLILIRLNLLSTILPLLPRSSVPPVVGLDLFLERFVGLERRRG